MYDNISPDAYGNITRSLVRIRLFRILWPDLSNTLVIFITQNLGLKSPTAKADFKYTHDVTQLGFSMATHNSCDNFQLVSVCYRLGNADLPQRYFRT